MKARAIYNQEVQRLLKDINNVEEELEDDDMPQKRRLRKQNELDTYKSMYEKLIRDEKKFEL